MADKYRSFQEDLFSIFASAGWQAEGIATYPREFTNIRLDSTQGRAIRFSIIFSNEGVNGNSSSGIVQFEIFTMLEDGPSAISAIADKLDSFLARKSISTYTNTCSQFFTSALGLSQPDPNNSALLKTIYSIGFQYTNTGAL